MSDIKKSIIKVIELIEERIKTEENPEKLIILKGKYQAAYEKLGKNIDVSADIKGTVRMYLDSYSDYMNNPIIEEMDKVEQLLKDMGINKYCSSRECNSKIARNVLQGAKIPHSISQPVIHFYEDRYYLAVFVFFYSKEDIEAGAVDRPSVWAIADIETGEIIKEYETKEKDFSDAPYDVKYNIRSDAQYDTSKEYYDKAFAILDSVREKLISSGKLYSLEYKAYLDRILANIPHEYQRFYRDLSV